MRFTGNGTTNCYPDQVDNLISITVLRWTRIVSANSGVGWRWLFSGQWDSGRDEAACTTIASAHAADLQTHGLPSARRTRRRRDYIHLRHGHQHACGILTGVETRLDPASLDNAKSKVTKLPGQHGGLTVSRSGLVHAIARATRQAQPN